MAAADHYRQLVSLGRDAFLAASAPAALVRHGGRAASASPGTTTLTLESDGSNETLQLDGGSVGGAADEDLVVYPIAKKPGASFADRITIGRTTNNDIVIAEHSVSRLHAYVKPLGDGWVVADAGSKNGSWLQGAPLEPRRERALPDRAVLRVGDIDLTFYPAVLLFTALGGR